jgi:L-seryl-tRNA(Ser) seleniumtransferase
MNSIDVLRLLPSVDQMLRKPEVQDMMERHARATVTEALRRVLQETRQSIMEDEYNGEISAGTIEGELVRALDERLKKESRGNLREVINGTGVVIHTNLGRSPIAEKAVGDLARLSGVYVNLEYDLESGSRGSRHDIVRDLLRGITGAEDCMVVNNNAAAVLLVLSAMASGKEVIVSRGELVEIGGSFRVPEVMEQGGARLVEVGTTNKTYIEDYRRAINENTGLLLKVHTSNYRICGFTRQASREELAALGREFGIPVVEDLGSGMFVDLGEYGIGHEPTVQDSIRSGMDIVTFSGDKLLGGPQAGIIAGRKEYIRKIAKHPLARAVRVDRLTLSVLESTLRIYIDFSICFIISQVRIIIQNFTHRRDMQFFAVLHHLCQVDPVKVRGIKGSPRRSYGIQGARTLIYVYKPPFLYLAGHVHRYLGLRIVFLNKVAVQFLYRYIPFACAVDL